jgi:hypothetical protein
MGYNLEKIGAKVRRILVVITTKIMGEMLHLHVSGIHVPPIMSKDEAHKFCLKFIDQKF